MSLSSEEQSGQLVPTGQTSWDMETVPIQMFSWISDDTGKGFPSRSMILTSQCMEFGHGGNESGQVGARAILNMV